MPGRMMFALALAVVLAAVMGGCHTFEGDMEKLCNVERFVDTRGLGEAEAGVKIAHWIDDNIHNQRVQNFFDRVAFASRERKVATLLALAQEAGLQRCAWAEKPGELPES